MKSTPPSGNLLVTPPDSSPEVKEIAKVLNNASPEAQQVVRRTILASVSQERLPIPSPQTLREFSEINPSFPERFMTAWENEMSHRRDMEKTVVTKSLAYKLTGMRFGLLITGAVLVVAWDLGRRGFVTVAGILGTVDLVALVGVFITAQLLQQRDDDRPSGGSNEVQGPVSGPNRESLPAPPKTP